MILSKCSSIFSFLQKKRYNLVSGLADIYISNNTEKIGATWSEGQVHDKLVIEKFYFLLKQKEGAFHVLDIGAQTGSFTLLAKFFPQSKWYAFEPIKEAADELNVNLRLNKIKNVTVHQVGVSDISGEKYLKLPKDVHWGLATLGENGIRFKLYDERVVTVLSLDEFIGVNNIKKIDFIKIDTEGWELNVLKGGKNMIHKDRPLILMELNEQNLEQCRISSQDIYQFLEEIGYEWEFVGREDLLCKPIKMNKD
jgi:FkbM family methyltransferase